MSSQSIIYFDRYEQQLKTEVVYGEGFLRWAYEHPVGTAAVHLLVKRALFSHWYGKRMSHPNSRNRINGFIQQYGINVDEMLLAPSEYKHFNDFFARKLKPEARPIAAGKDAVIFPADGRHFVIPSVSTNDGIFVKGIRFDLETLLDDEDLAKRFAHGSMLISRLCPVDYHRFHFPWNGKPTEARLINGDLYSVSPIALRRRPSLLWENKRYLTQLKTPEVGDVLILDVGATCVGTVVNTYTPGKPVAKGDEKGYFLFGGSCVITIFEPDRIRFADDLLEHSAQRREVYARMGDQVATVINPS